MKIARLLLPFAAVLALAGSAQAFTITGTVWPDPAVITYQVSTVAVPKGVNVSDYVTQVRYWADQWSAVTPNVRLVYGGTTTIRPMTISQTCNYNGGNVIPGAFTWNNDGLTVIGFADLFGATCNSGILGLTSCHYLNGQPNCDIAIDTRQPTSWTWTVKKGTYQGGFLAVHEMGHMLGLGHSTAGCAMYPTAYLGEAHAAICPDDIAGLLALYP